MNFIYYLTYFLLINMMFKWSKKLKAMLLGHYGRRVMIFSQFWPSIDKVPDFLNLKFWRRLEKNLRWKPIFFGYLSYFWVINYFWLFSDYMSFRWAQNVEIWLIPDPEKNDQKFEKCQNIRFGYVRVWDASRNGWKAGIHKEKYNVHD